VLSQMDRRLKDGQEALTRGIEPLAIRFAHCLSGIRRLRRRARSTDAKAVLARAIRLFLTPLDARECANDFRHAGYAEPESA
jgi:hypothetical protein